MGCYRYKTSVALIVAFVVGFGSHAVADELVPLKGSLDGNVTHTSVDDHTDFVVIAAGGNATYLGKFDLIGPHFVDTPTRTAAGYYQFTAANGDLLYAEFTGEASPTEAFGVLLIVETASITGGTGRFAGATGEFVVERLYDRIAGTTIGHFEGAVSRPGK